MGSEMCIRDRVHRTLMQYGYELKKKYESNGGREKLKKNIRFEDAEHTFVIDIKFPGSSDNEWTTVSYERALEDRKENNYDRERQQGDLLSSRRGSSSSVERNQIPAGDGAAGPGLASAGTVSTPIVPPSGTNPNDETWGMHR